MSYQLIAIKINSDCPANIHKCLHKDKIYFFTSGYSEDKSKEFNLIKTKTIQDKIAYKSLYNIKRKNLSDLNVTVSALVGMNGDGKSTCVEIVIRLLNNFAYKYGFLDNQESLDKIIGLSARLYYEIDDEVFCISCRNDEVKWYQNGNEIEDIDNNWTDKKKKEELKNFQHSHLFYTMVINYSLYAYNSELLKDETVGNHCWIDGLFHKNDGYQTPIVLNPMRNSGNIDVNREEYLSRQRLMSLFSAESTSEESRKISDTEEAVGFAFSITKEPKLIKKTIREYFVKVRSEECLWSDKNQFPNPGEWIQDPFLESFSAFWHDFDNDYRENKVLFDIGFKTNSDWERNARTDLGRYLNIIKFGYTRYYKGGKQYNFRDISIFCRMRGPMLNYLQFYRLLIILLVWKSLKSQNFLPLKNKTLNDILLHPENTINACILYILYKVISILETYNGLYKGDYMYDKSYDIMVKPWPNEHIQSQIDEDIKTILSTHDYRTLKLWQTINYLKRSSDDLYGAEVCTIDKIKERYGFYIPFNELSKSYKGMTIKEIMPLLPSPVFSGDIVLYNGKDYYTVNCLSSGMTQRLNSVGSFIYHLRNLDDSQSEKTLIEYSNITAIFEEVELYFHPEYQKSYLKYLLKQIERANLQRLSNLHIILVTHSPFVLSDVLTDNILCLKSGKPDPKNDFHSFGANIHDILRQPFFMQSGTIGDYAQDVINRIILLLDIHIYCQKTDNTIESYFEENSQFCKYAGFLYENGRMVDADNFKITYNSSFISDLIEMIDEPIAKHSLRREYNQVFNK